jgi:hypothetical protein
MSIEAMACVLHHAAVSGTDKVVLLGIANHDGDGGAWPTLDTLTKYANVDKRNVRASLRRLEAKGMILTLQQQGGNDTCPDYERPNRYEVLVRCPLECDGTKNHRMPGDRGYVARQPVDNHKAGGDASIRGGRTPASGGGGMPASPKPSFEPSRNQTSPTPPPAAPSPPAVPRQNGGGSHPHHTNTANAISEDLHEAGLPADLHGPILEACYRIGHGNPWRAWTDSPIRDHLTNLGGVHNPVAVIKARLRDTRPLPPSRPATAPCPLHPGQPAGRCNQCAHEAQKPPAGWRKTRSASLPGNPRQASGQLDLAG